MIWFWKVHKAQSMKGKGIWEKRKQNGTSAE